MLQCTILSIENKIESVGTISFFLGGEYSKVLYWNTPGTAGGPGGRDRTLAVKSRKNGRKYVCFVIKKNYQKKIAHIF